MNINYPTNQHKETYSISFFGHRDIENLIEIDRVLLPFLKKILSEKAYVTFYIGRNGNFDEYVASLVKTVRKTLSNENGLLILVLPYKVKDIEYYCDYYDDVIIPDCLNGVHYKNAITYRNRWMIDQSDLIIANVTRRKGGAYTAVKYAQRKGKMIWNVTDVQI